MYSEDVLTLTSDAPVMMHGLVPHTSQKLHKISNVSDTDVAFISDGG